MNVAIANQPSSTSANQASTMEMQDILTTVNGEPITVQDVAVHLKVNGVFRNTIYQLVETRVIALKCQELDIKICDEEFYEHADAKRRLAGLVSAFDMNRHCKWHGIVMDQWNEQVYQDLRRKQLKERVVTDAEVAAFYEAHRPEFAMAWLSRIVCEGEAHAQRVAEHLRTNGEDFAAVARRESVERNTRLAGGYLGCIKYGGLPKAINDAVFAAQPGDLLGPFEQSDYWVVYRLEDLNEPTLDEGLRNTIADHLFQKWLQTEVLNAKA
jgi:peptidylprolyl isomerase